MNSFIGKIGGRKFIVALFAMIAVVLQHTLGINPEVVYTIGGVAAAYVTGQGIADGMSGGATSSVAIAHDTVQVSEAPKS